MKTFDEYKGVELSGRAASAFFQAFGQFKELPSKLLLAEGVGKPGPDGMVVLDPEAWYPFDAYLRAVANVEQQMGDSVLHQIGVSLPKTLEWPPIAKDLKSLAQILDMAYHVNHRKDGIVMGDPATGRIKEGIGHYQYRERPDGTVEIESSIPMPCAFDKGLLFGALRKLFIVGAIVHGDSHPCRKRGSASCVYVIKPQAAH